MKALAEALVGVLEDERLRGRVGKGAVRRFGEKFHVRDYGRRLAQLRIELRLHVRQATRSIREEKIS